MKIRFRVILLAAAAGIAAVAAYAADSDDKAVRDAFHSLLPNAKIDRVVKSEVPGFYEVVVGGQVVYISSDGKYLLQGNLYDVPAKKSLTDARIASIRAEALRSLPADKMMTFAPEHP
jgi:thiol:disulfide interchange protein DsbC